MSGGNCKRCGKPSSLVCPNCKQLGLPPAYYCGRECFKEDWPEHKLLHNQSTTTTSTTTQQIPQYLIDRPEFAGYIFTGPLRPAKLSPRREVPDHIPKPDYALDPNGTPYSEITNKASHTILALTDPEKIANMRRACEIAAEVLAEAGNIARPGITTDEIDKFVHDLIIAKGAYPSPLNYKLFPKSCCTSINEVICHGIPDATVLKDGDIMNLDISVYYNGFHGDVSETWLIGDNVDENAKRLLKTTYECLEKAIAMVKPNTLYRNIGDVISKHAHQNGFSVVRTYCGHGVGELFHCAPTVPHYGKNRAVGVMKPGHTFTIEPMINEGHWKDKLWPDNWTSVTVDGKRSAQFEHTLLVTETGCEILTKRPWGDYINRFKDKKVV